MKVFLSWSGKTSREVAQAFHDWLPFVIQAVRPFISTGDIDKGKRWTDVLASELNETGYGILVVTPDNMDKPWLHSRRVRSRRQSTRRLSRRFSSTSIRRG